MFGDHEREGDVISDEFIREEVSPPCVLVEARAVSIAVCGSCA